MRAGRESDVREACWAEAPACVVGATLLLHPLLSPSSPQGHPVCRPAAGPRGAGPGLLRGRRLELHLWWVERVWAEGRSSAVATSTAAPALRVCATAASAPAAAAAPSVHDTPARASLPQACTATWAWRPLCWASCRQEEAAAAGASLLVSLQGSPAAAAPSSAARPPTPVHLRFRTCPPCQQLPALAWRPALTSPKRRLWNQAHWWVGRAAALVAIANVYEGEERGGRPPVSGGVQACAAEGTGSTCSLAVGAVTRQARCLPSTGCRLHRRAGCERRRVGGLHSCVCRHRGRLHRVRGVRACLL